MKIYGTESNDYILKEFGKRIQDTRISVTMTQRELAERAGVSLSTMERIENGDNVKIENRALLSLIHEMVPWTKDSNRSSIKDMCTRDDVRILEICESLENESPVKPMKLRKTNSLTDQLEALASKTTGGLIGLDESEFW